MKVIANRTSSSLAEYRSSLKVRLFYTNMRLRYSAWLGIERLSFALREPPEISGAVLIVGSGRSGTTWLADVLSLPRGIQQIFEPLNPVWSKEVRDLTGYDQETLRVRSPFLSAKSSDADWIDLTERMLQGRVRTPWTDPVRNAVVPQRYVIKLIRANLMVGFLASRFSPRLIFVQRHPCSVVASRLRLNWRADVQDILCQESLVETYLRDHISAIEREKDAVGAHAVWWAVENFVAGRELKGRSHLKVNYEEARERPMETAQIMYRWLGWQLPDELEDVLERPSRQSKHKAVLGTGYGIDTDRYLSPEDQERIMGWANRFDLLDAYDYD